MLFPPAPHRACSPMWPGSIGREGLYQTGVTRGCSSQPLLCCPDEPVTRAQMASFIITLKPVPAKALSATAKHRGLFGVPETLRFCYWERSERRVCSETWTLRMLLR